MTARPDVPDTPDRTDAIARLLAIANGTEWDLMPGDDCVYRRDADAILTTDDPAAIAALAATLAERHPNARDRASYDKGYADGLLRGRLMVPLSHIPIAAPDYTMRTGGGHPPLWDWKAHPEGPPREEGRP